MATKIEHHHDLGDFNYGTSDQVTPLIRRVICKNPTPFTYKGTGTYLVGQGEVAVIDPGPPLESHLDDILAALDPDETIICGTRYGNVMASRGSVIPLMCKQIEENTSLTITDPSMTRFLMTLEDAVDLVMYAFANGKNGDMFVQKAPATTIDTLARSLTSLLNKDDYPIEVIGTRHGEKLYETLLSREEMVFAYDLGDYFRIPPDLRDLNYGKYIENGEKKISHMEDYNSHNTERLNIEQVKNLLLKLDYFEKGNINH